MISSQHMRSVRGGRRVIIRLRNPETGDPLTPIRLVLYAGLPALHRAMRDWERHHDLPLTDEDDSALACVQGVRQPIIRFSQNALSMRVVIHECAHAAMWLRYSPRGWAGLPELQQRCITEPDERYCHILDDVFISVLDTLLQIDELQSMPIDLPRNA